MQGSVCRATGILCYYCSANLRKKEPQILQDVNVKSSSQRNGHQELSECNDVELTRFIYVYKNRRTRAHVKQPLLTVWKIDKVRITLLCRK